jgi:hypothetical protein
LTGAFSVTLGTDDTHWLRNLQSKRTNQVILGGWRSMQKLKETLNEVRWKGGWPKKRSQKFLFISFCISRGSTLVFLWIFHLRKEERSYTYSLGVVGLLCLL